MPSSSDSDEGEPFLDDIDEENVAETSAKGSKRSGYTKKKSRRSFGFNKNKDVDKKDVEKELDKVNDNFWPIGDRNLTSTEKIAIGAGVVAASLGMCTVFVFVSAGVGAIGTSCGMVAGGLTAVTVPHAIYNQVQLTKMDTFRDVINAIRGSVNTFADTNKDLHNNIDGLEESVESLKELENSLRDIAKRQGMQLDELNELLEENRRINIAMSKVLRASALQRILALLIECDIDGDYKLSGMELNRFIIGLSSIEELSVDTEQLHAGLKEYEDFDINTFLDLIQDIIFPEEKDDDSVLEDDEWEEAAVVEAVKIVDGRSFLKKKKAEADAST